MYVPGERFGALLALATVLLVGGCGGTVTETSDSGSVGATTDPVVLDFPVAFVQRPLLEDPDSGELLVESDPRDPTLFRPGGDLFLMERASASAVPENVTEPVTGGEGDVRDVTVSPDGRKLAFALRLPEIENADEDEQPSWNIWEYDLDTAELRRVITSDLVAEEGDDLFPAYLPDGRIVFASTRQRATGAQLIDDGRPRYPTLVPGEDVPALQLHVMDDSGSGIEQITFGEGHDLAPTITPDGWVVFARHIVTGGEAIRLYRVRPDGTGLQLLYGANSHQSGTGDTAVQFLQPRPLEDGRILVLLRPFEGTASGGDLIAVDVENFADLDQPLPQSAGLLEGGQARLTTQDVRTEPGPSPGGRFVSAWPLDDGSGRLLTAWAQCRLVRTDDGRIVPCTEDGITLGWEEAPPLVGLWVFDPLEDSQLPVRLPAEGFVIDDVVVARNTPFANENFDPERNAFLAEAGLGVLQVRSIYDVDGVDTAVPDLPTVANPTLAPLGARDPRTTPFLVRIVKEVPLPDEDLVDLPNEALGPNRRLGMREIVGYTPLEPDGSVRVLVPANVRLGLEVLNLEGERIGPRHDFWITVAPGEVLTCAGCHDAGSGYPHGRLDAETPVNQGLAGADGTFPGTDGALRADGSGADSWTMAEARAFAQAFGLASPPASQGYCAGLGASNCLATPPTLDLIWEDFWSPDTVAPPPPETVEVRHELAVLADPAVPDAPAPAGLPTPSPLATTSPESCSSDGTDPAAWSRNCRWAIHYEDHIQPIWERARPFEGMDRSCVSCHTRETPLPDPLPQLDLRAGASFAENQLPMNSYAELFQRAAREEVVGDAVQPVVEILTDPVTGDPLCAVDAEGNPVVDPDTGECLQFQQRIPQTGPYLSAGGARASRNLRDPETGELENLFHRAANPTPECFAHLLTDAELQLLREWVDIGAQYYNDPFLVPLD
jgi:hypothetical protein